MVDINDRVFNSGGWNVMNISSQQRHYIELVGYYGYEYPGHQTDRYWLATQQLIWERMNSNVSVKFTTGENGSGSIIDLSKEKNEILKLVNKYEEQIKDEKQKVIDAGGLKIIGTERHESRRIDNQLRGRSGRQGDNGESRFYIALDDDLMKIFGGNTITKLYNSLGVDENMPIEVKILSRAVENAQKKVEGRNFSIRKNVLQYDDVMNRQRSNIYEQRREVLDGENLKDSEIAMIKSVAEEIVPTYVNGNEIDRKGLSQEIFEVYGIESLDTLKDEKSDAESIIAELQDKAVDIYEDKCERFGESLRELERVVMLKVVDEKWMNHIDSMDELKNGIGLRAYGQQDPVVKYRMEGMDMFEEMKTAAYLQKVNTMEPSSISAYDILKMATILKFI